jgi:hypothetical protein
VKRLWLVLLLAACAKKEAVAPPAAPPKVKPAPAPAALAARPQTDDYDAALGRFRESRGFRFDIAVGPTHATGEMARPTPGMERVTFQASGARWMAEAKPNGVVWTKDGKPVANEPAWADRIYQWVTIYFDPQKTAPPQPIGSHLRFLNQNNGEVNDVWIANGEIVRVQTSGAGEAFPPVDLKVSR